MTQFPHPPAVRPAGLAAGLLAAGIGLALTAEPAPAAIGAAAPEDVRPAAAPADPGFRYAYFGRLIELEVDPTMVAAFVAPPAGGLEADPAPALAAAGLPADRVQPSSVPGWSYVSLPEDGRSRAAALAEVDRLGGTGAFDMVSPVLLGEGGLPMVPTRDLLVRFRPGVDEAAADALLAEHGAAVLERDAAGLPGLVRARTDLAHGPDVLELAIELDAHPDTVFAQSDTIYWARRSGTPNDPLFPQQWALEQPSDQDMDALGAWALERGDPQIAVVVLDSGIQQDHPDLTQQTGATFAAGGGSGGPNGQCDNHGTAVAGCVSATIDNGIGVVGIAPDASVRSGKIFNEIFFLFLCLPFLESQDSWTVEGITWSADSGARVTNSSWGGGSPSAAISSAFAATREAGVIHFAAAGNDGTGSLGYPASLSTVNAVSALASSGQLASFSTFGPGTFLAAPGAGILTTDRTGGDGYSSGPVTTIDGTSFASPYAAGVAALVLSADPSLTPDEVEAILSQTAVDRGAPGYDPQYGWGFVNARAAVEAVLGGGCPADLDGSGAVGFDDVLAVLAAWGPCDGCPADLDASGDVGFDDVLAVLAEWGDCG